MQVNIKDYSEWKQNVTNKDLKHFYYYQGSQKYVVALDGSVYYIHKLTDNNESDYAATLEGEANKKFGRFYSREPFATKFLEDGSKLFRRKHGKKQTITANSSSTIVFTVPYSRAKINKLEIIDANPLDRVDLIVKSPADPALASAYGFPPDFILNQFGFDVVVSNLLYSDKSDYDADVFAGFQIVVTYKNDTNSDKEVGFNLIYHEVVSV